MEGITIDVAADVDVESFDSILTSSEECLTEEAFKVYRAKAIQRLRNKRNEMREEEIKEHEMEFKQSHMNRDKWISQLKAKRELDLKSSVSRAAVLKALVDYPQIFDNNGRTFIQKEWNEIAPDVYVSDVHSAIESTNPVLHLVPASADDDELAVDDEDNNVPHTSTGYSSSAMIGGMGVDGMNTVVTAAYLRHTTPAVRSHRLSISGREGPMQATGLLAKYTQKRTSLGDRSDALSHKKDKSPTHKALRASTTDAARPESRHSSPDKTADSPSSLIDSLLLVGPTKKDVDDFLEHICNDISVQEARAAGPVDLPMDTSFQSISAPSATAGVTRPASTPGRNRSSSNSSMTSNVSSIAHGAASPIIIKQTRNIAPDIVFVTSQDPDVEMDALVSFCFPSGVETSVSASPANPLLLNTLTGPYARASLRSIGRGAVATSPPDLSHDSSLASTSSLVSPMGVSSGGAGVSTRSVFLLTNHHSSQFGICLSVPRVIFSTYRDKAFVIKTSYSLCIITPLPFFGFFFHVLAEFINMRGLLLDTSGVVGRQEPGDPIKAELRQLESFAMKLLRQMAPKPGTTLDFSVTVNMAHREVPLKRLPIHNFDEEVSIGTLQWALPILLRNIPLDQILLVLGCALTEMRIVIRAANLETLSGCVLALVYLLRPLHWAGPIISILPAMMHDILDSPVPVFIGVEATPKSFKMTNGLIVVDPAQKLIHMHPSDVVSSHTFCLPQASKLQQTLKPIADNILKLLRKLRKTRRRSSGLTTEETSNGQNKSSTAPDRASSAMSPVDSGDSDKDSDNAEFPPQNQQAQASLKKSMSSVREFSRKDSMGEIVHDSIASSPLLTQNISKFADAVKNHLQTLVNTTVQINWEKKVQRQQAKEDLMNAPKERVVQKSPSENSIASMSDMSIFTQELPEPQSNAISAPVFPRQLIGSSAYSFIGMFSKTQLFCEYCERHRSTNAVISEIVKSERGAGSKLASAHEAESKADEAEEGYFSMEGSTVAAEVGSANQYDPLVMLFSIILSGTCPVSDNKAVALMDTFGELYSDCAVVKDDTKAQQLREQWATRYSAITSPRATDDVDGANVPTHAPFSSPGEAVNTLEIPEESLWCNGRCNGLANTSSCTNICIDIWETRVHNLKKQKRAVDIVRSDSTILAPGKFVR
jgi:hypothetical protein